MNNIASYIAKIIALNGGTLIGKTRLQKTAYFLEELCDDSDLDFDYHYYGPYSEELSIGIADAQALGYIKSEWKSTKVGTEYAVFQSFVDLNEEYGDKEKKRVLEILSNYDSVSIELAATVDFLSKNGFPEDAWEETIRRKEDKSTDDRIRKAKSLLKELTP